MIHKNAPDGESFQMGIPKDFSTLKNKISPSLQPKNQAPVRLASLSESVGFLNLPHLFSGGARVISALKIHGRRNISFDELEKKIQQSSVTKDSKEAALQLVGVFKNASGLSMYPLKITQGIPYSYEGAEEPDTSEWKDLGGNNKVPPQVKRAWDTAYRQYKKATGRNITVQSAYRSPAYQLYTFSKIFMSRRNFQNTLSSSSLPYFSEHGSSNPAIDVKEFAGRENAFKNIMSSDWRKFREIIEKNGFVVTYPFGTKGVVNGMGEPWHIRYLPDEVAKVQKDRKEKGEFGMYSLHIVQKSRAFRDDLRKMPIGGKILENAITFAKLLKKHSWASDVFGIADMDVQNLSSQDKKQIGNFVKLIQWQLGITADGEYGSGTHKKLKEYFGKPTRAPDHVDERDVEYFVIKTRVYYWSNRQNKLLPSGDYGVRNGKVVKK